MIVHSRYEEASSGVKGDSTHRCLDCATLVANRYDHERTAHMSNVTSAYTQRMREAVALGDERRSEGRCGGCGAFSGPDHLCPADTPTKASREREEIDESIRSALLEDAITEGYDPQTGRYDTLGERF